MTVMINALPFLWEGLMVTLKLSALAVAIALVAGLVLGVALVYGPRWLYWPIRLYSDILRGLPTPVLIFAVYYLLPVIGWNIDNFVASVLALSTFEAARVLEVTRGAIQSIHPGQTDAGKAIGLTFSQRMIYVIFPQALRRFLPPWINSVVDTVKGSSLASFLGIVELTLGIQQVIGRTFEPMPLYILGIMIYFAINFTLSTTSRRLEARFAYIRE
jgi:polar amino acid transport system permease protein